LAPLLGALDAPPLRRGESRLDTERLQALNHLGADSTINPHAAKGDAWLAPIAGAYVFGRTGSRITIEGGRKRIVRGFRMLARLLEH